MQNLSDERQHTLLQNLILEEIAFWKDTFKDRSYSKKILNHQVIVNTLEKMYLGLDTENPDNMSSEHKLIIVQLLQRVITELEKDRDIDNDSEQDKMINQVLQLLILEYHLMLNKFLISINESNKLNQ